MICLILPPITPAFVTHVTICISKRYFELNITDCSISSLFIAEGYSYAIRWQLK